jgi:hypothetical protein
MTLRLNGSTSGYTEIDAPAVAGSNTLVLPTGNGTADQVISTNGSGTLSFVDRGRMVLETAKASTSGTSVDFTGIPSWVKKITVMLQGVSTNGTSNLLLQLGSGSFTTTGYTSSASYASTGVQSSTSTIGLILASDTVAARIYSGNVMVCLQNTNRWTSSAVLSQDSAATQFSGGASPTLSGTLDRVRITTVNGTDTFDAGSLNLLLEG